jgi:hypothetical protein
MSRKPRPPPPVTPRPDAITEHSTRLAGSLHAFDGVDDAVGGERSVASARASADGAVVIPRSRRSTVLSRSRWCAGPRRSSSPPAVEPGVAGRPLCVRAALCVASHRVARASASLRGSVVCSRRDCRVRSASALSPTASVSNWAAVRSWGSFAWRSRPSAGSPSSGPRAVSTGLEAFERERRRPRLVDGLPGHALDCGSGRRSARRYPGRATRERVQMVLVVVMRSPRWRRRAGRRGFRASRPFTEFIGVRFGGGVLSLCVAFRAGSGDLLRGCV